jgi:hypothetical protein
MRTLAPALALALALLAGCLAPGASVSPASGAADLAPAAFGAIHKLGSDGNEPVVRVAPDGTIYVAALQYVWVSRDNGSTFQQVDATGSLPIYASDSALAVAPDGRAYVAFDWPYAGETAVCTSHDRGATWACSPIVVPGATDRMWVVAPTEKDAYVITGEGLDRPTFAVTHDAGGSWSITSFDPQTSSQGADLAWDGVHKLVVEGAFTDGGWGVREWKPDGTFVGVKPMKIKTPEAELQVDAAGTWWAVSCLNDTMDAKCPLAVAKSTDAGDSWTRVPIPTQRLVELPYVTAGAADHVAIAWYEANGTTPSDAANAWRVSVARSTDGASFVEQVVSGDKPVHAGAMCSSASCLGEDRFAGDFLGVAFGPSTNCGSSGSSAGACGPDGALHATWMRQTGSKGVPTTQLKTSPWDDVEYARTS